MAKRSRRVPMMMIAVAAATIAVAAALVVPGGQLADIGGGLSGSASAGSGRVGEWLTISAWGEFVDATRDFWTRIVIVALATTFLFCSLRALARALRRIEATNDRLMAELSARQRMEQALRQSKARAAEARQQLLDAIESSAASFMLFDADERLVLCNNKTRKFCPELAELLVPGIRFQDLTRARAEHATPPSAAGRIEEWVSERLDQFRHPGSAIEEQHADGRWTHVVERRTADGGTVCVRTDITELKRADEAIRKLSRDNELILSAAGEGIIGLDGEGRTTFVNPSGARMIGWEPEELIGRPQHDIVHRTKPDGSTHSHEECPINAAVNDGELHHVSGEIFWRRDGTSFPVEYTSTPIREGNELVGAVVVYRDISERRRFEEQLRQAQKMEVVGHLTGGVAHDFNNILAAIMINLELLEGRLEGDGERRGLARKAMAAARRGADVTGRLLAFSRKQALRPRLTDLNGLVTDTLELLSRTLGETIEIETVLADGLWPTLVDASQLESALLNLAVNARDAMPNGGKLTLETANARLDDEYAAAHDEMQAGPYVMLAVRDTGNGMPPEIMDKAVEPFFTTKEVGEGSGLGLSMVYGFVKQSCGHMKIDSEVNRGTTVKLYLPRSHESPVADEAASFVSARPGKGEAVLLVEDEDDVRTPAATLLADLGYRPLEARDASAALAVLEQTPEVAVLFTDVVLPGSMSGPELAREARRRRPDLKVLFTSGYTERTIAQHGRLDDDAELLQKPYRKEILAQKLSAIVTQG